jgi:hypothetical protein
MNTSMPMSPNALNDRAVLFALLDAVSALSSRLFPDEVMSVRIPDGGDGQYVTGHTLTTWIPISKIFKL